MSAQDTAIFLPCFLSLTAANPGNTSESVIVVLCLVDVYLASLAVVLAVYPPLPLYLQILLEIEQQVCRGHCSAGEEVCGHPAICEVVWRSSVDKDMHKEIPLRRECAC